MVRIDGINPAANGLNSQAEWRALLAAHQAGWRQGRAISIPIWAAWCAITWHMTTPATVA